MAKPSLTIPINSDLGNQAQAVFNDMGLDIATVVDYLLRQIVHNKGIISSPSSTNTMPQSNHELFEKTTISKQEETLFRLYASLEDSFSDINNAKGKPVKFGGWEGKLTIADDFNAPPDDFEEYM